MTFKVPVGPQHPALHEPERFEIEVEGEEIVDADVRMGYMHRGIEKALTERSYHRGVYLAERICGICSVAHTTCYTQAAERLANIEVPERAQYIRIITAELERIHSHLLWAGVAAEEIGFQTLFMTLMRDREAVMDLLESISGNRVNYAINKVGGVRRDIKPGLAKEIRKKLEELEESSRYYVDAFSSDSTVKARCRDKGILTKKNALELCAVGPVARGSGINLDIRKDDPYGKYKDLSFEVITKEEGDILAKAMVRLEELLESISIIRQALEKMPSGPIKSEEAKGLPIGVGEGLPEGEGTGRIEAPRGELIYHIKSDGGKVPSRVKVRTPTIANIPPILEMLKGETMAEVPIVIESIDQCFACADRVTIVDRDSERTRKITLRELREKI
ncbi:MAG: nickel-dependent hydrogenase large subunit [Candidatus Hadarchaeia archaeon]